MLKHEQLEFSPVLHEGKLLAVEMIANRTQLLMLTQFAPTKDKVAWLSPFQLFLETISNETSFLLVMIACTTTYCDS